jgi:hypothetical protein
VLALGFGQRGAAYIVLGMLALAATLESVFAYCLGCKVFGLLMRAGVIPEEVCERCNNILAPPPAAKSDLARRAELASSYPLGRVG